MLTFPFLLIMWLLILDGSSMRKTVCNSSQGGLTCRSLRSQNTFLSSECLFEKCFVGCQPFLCSSVVLHIAHLPVIMQETSNTWDNPPWRLNLWYLCSLFHSCLLFMTPAKLTFTWGICQRLRCRIERRVTASRVHLPCLEHS